MNFLSEDTNWVLIGPMTSYNQKLRTEFSKSIVSHKIQIYIFRAFAILFFHQFR